MFSVNLLDSGEGCQAVNIFVGKVNIVGLRRY